jgi:hypothetical protein
MTGSLNVVIPAKAGIQKMHNEIERLDSRLRGDDGKLNILTF